MTTNKASSPLPVTIATVTYRESFVNFSDFLNYLRPVIDNYGGQCELIVVDNSGPVSAKSTEKAVKKSGIGESCSYTVIGSPENNISIARNIAINSTKTELIIFIDDDEFPVPNWISHLVETHESEKAAFVSGPTYPLFLFPTPNWIKTVDLHNAKGKRTGQILDKCGAGNLLIHLPSITGELFNNEYGRTGGEDTEFVARQVKNGLKLVWCSEAEAHEFMPKNKSTSKYFIKRFIVQGQIHRRVMLEGGHINSVAYFVSRSLLMISLSLLVAPALLAISSDSSGKWIKRGFANVGHLIKSSKQLYPNT